MTQTNTKGQVATPEFIWGFMEQYKLNIPHLLDADKAFYKYATGTSISLPFSVAFDLRTMKVVKAGSGSTSLATIEKTFLNL